METPQQRNELKVLLKSALIFLCTTSTAFASWPIIFDGGCAPPGGNVSNPVVREGIVYAGSFDGGVYAFDAQTGEQRWRYETGKGLVSGTIVAGSLDEALTSMTMPKREVVATPVIRGGTVYIGSKDHKFYALDSKAGDLRWSTDTGGQIFFEAIVDSNQVLIADGNGGMGNGFILALDAINGAKRWMFDSIKFLNLSSLHRRGVTKPVLHNDILYTTTSGIDNESGKRISYLFAIDAKSGSLRWRFAVKDSSSSVPAIIADGSVLFAVRADNTDIIRLHAVDATKGEQKWVFEADRKIGSGSSILARNGLTYFATNTTVVALDANTGQLRWRIEGEYGDKIKAENIELAEHLLVLVKNDLYGIDLNTGKVAWTIPVGHYPQIRSIVDNVVYVFSGAGNPDLKAIDSRNGKELWMFRTTGPIFIKKGRSLCSGPAKSDGRLFFTTWTELDYPGQHPNQSSNRGRLYNVNAAMGK